MPTPLLRAFCFNFFGSRPTNRMLQPLFLALALLACSCAVFAQTSPTQGYAGYTLYLHGTTASTLSGFNQVGDWRIYGPNSGSALAASSSGPTNGWTLTSALTVGISSTSASPGNYTAEYCFRVTSTPNKQTGDYTYTYYYSGANFTVVATPPTLPPAGNPAFSWQGSVAGVNTGNGNKTTVVPITGWTQRGGMPVSCALYHNSQGLAYGPYGTKWLPSYSSYFTSDASGNLTVHWDNGLSYTFTKSGTTTYTPLIGILDQLTLKYGSYGPPILTTTNNTVYNFAYLPASGQPGYGNAYLSSVTDMDGNTLTINHNTDTTISTVTDSTNRTLTYGYASGHLTSITDPLSRVSVLYYTGSDLTQINTPVLNGQYYAAVVMGYDGSHDINSLKNTRGYASTFGYNANSSLAWAKDPIGNQTTFTYNANNTVITDPNGHTTTHTYTYSRLSSVTDALGDTSYSNYDVDNILTSTKDKRGNLWSYSSHFTNGTSNSVSTDPLSYTTTTTYDAKNKVTQTVDPLGNVSGSTYSTDGKEDLLTSSITGTGTAPFKATSTVGGYSYGLPTTFTDPLKYSSSVGYDANGYANTATDANNHTSTAVSNVLGWKTSSTDANNNTTSYTYDGWGRVTAITAPDNTQTTTTYDLDGNVLTVTDANNHTVTNVYDTDDRLIQTTNGRGDVVRYTYDGTDSVTGAPQRGLLSSKTDGNWHTTYYSYTARNEPSATYYPDGTREGVTYDPNGNTLTRTKADGKVIQYAYDADNRLTDITYPTLHAVHFGYDADGRKTLMTDATGTTTWSYSYDGVHLSQQATPQGTVNYTYDGDGRRSQMGLAGQQYPWVYSYDNAGRLYKLQSPSDGTTTYVFDAANRVTQMTQGNGNYQTYAYDTCNEVTGIGYYNPGGNLQNGLTYNYDPAGNVTYCNQNWYSTTYGYDGADQLVSETGANGNGYTLPNRTFTYDHNGNRLTQTVGGSASQSFGYDAHDKLTSGTGETDGYDNNGNQTSVLLNGTSSTRIFDDEDRLTSITSGGVTDTFTYNGLGLRVGKTDSTGTYSYLCDGTSPGSPVLSDGHAIYTPGQSETRGGVSSYDSFDRLGNLWTVATTPGSQTFYQDTSAFGSAGFYAGTDPSPFQFGGGNGCLTDADTGLVLMGHRYYDTRQGRFISQDPAGSGDNWYAYAGNNPTNKTDPSGLQPPDGPGSSPVGTPGYADGAASGSAGAAYYNQEFLFTQTWTTQNGHYVRGSYSYTLSPLGSWGGMLPGGMGAFGKGLSVFPKEYRTWVNYARFRSQGAARYGILANTFFIVNGISYMGNPASGSAGSNALQGGSGILSIVAGVGTTSAGLDMAIGGTTAAAAWGGLAAATGIGAVIVGGAVVGVAGYRASDAWVNTTPSGIGFTDALGSATYSAGKFLGIYNFILPFNFWTKVELHTHKPQHIVHHCPVHHSVLHHQQRKTRLQTLTKLRPPSSTTSLRSGFKDQTVISSCF